jgi:hypothetical protein
MFTPSELSIRSLAALLAAIALAACTTPDNTTDHAVHHPEPAAASPAQPGGMRMEGQSGAGMMGETASGQMKSEGMDMNHMCAMYRNMQNMPTEERQAMLDQQMKGMSPEMRQQHMEMMRQQCK